VWIFQVLHGAVHVFDFSQTFGRSCFLGSGIEVDLVANVRHPRDIPLGVEITLPLRTLSFPHLSGERRPQRVCLYF